MTTFELVKITLDALYVRGQKRYGTDIDKRIQEKLAYLSTAYGGLTVTGRSPIDYEDPATRFAYVFMYVAAHGDYLVQILESYKAKIEANIFNDASVKVSCIGGGPGSDIVAILKFLDEFKTEEPVSKIAFFLLDKEQAWADTWIELDDAATGTLSLTTSFQLLDVTKPATYQNLEKFLSADIFTLSYFVSEVLSFNADGSVTQFFQHVFDSAKPGALFLYNDNSDSRFTDFFDGMWKTANVECLKASNAVSMIPRLSERASELGEYLTKFGRHPKLRSSLSHRLLRKKSR